MRVEVGRDKLQACVSVDSVGTDQSEDAREDVRSVVEW
jgi:hypothetical protein